MRLTAWRVALRIARRDALRAKGRSALVVAMVALPVLGVTGADVVFRSAELDPVERVVRTMGQSDAELRLMERGAIVLQAPDPDTDYSHESPSEAKTENGQPKYTPSSAAASTPSPACSPASCSRPAPCSSRSVRARTPPPAAPRACSACRPSRPTSPTRSGVASSTWSRAGRPAPTTRSPPPGTSSTGPG
ncbi:hypothetical protein ACFQ0M_29695 [Kitasatospora aburaviensis]